MRRRERRTCERQRKKAGHRSALPRDRPPRARARRAQTHTHPHTTALIYTASSSTGGGGGPAPPIAGLLGKLDFGASLVAGAGRGARDKLAGGLEAVLGALLDNDTSEFLKPPGIYGKRKGREEGRRGQCAARAREKKAGWREREGGSRVRRAARAVCLGPVFGRPSPALLPNNHALPTGRRPRRAASSPARASVA